jgi:putative Ca2+/H+ antiporter (TMEM165/GDT1 family)
MTDLLTALVVVFLAELGDKTQLVALGFGARQRLAPVLTGVALAYVATNLVSVVVGGLLGAALPTRAIGLGGGALFLAFAVWTWRSDDGPADRAAGDVAGDAANPSAAPAHRSGQLRVVGSVAAAMFVAELGDKTMIATATLAARDNPVLVWVGATIGIFLAGALGVVVGRLLGARLPERVTRLGSAAVFALFGIVLIVTSW